MIRNTNNLSGSKPEVDMMDFSSSESYKWLEELRCTTCNNYLSHFPIYITANSENVCGRCAASPKTGYIRNEVYERASQEIKFPCRYTQEGCYEKLTAQHVPDHEKSCPYRTRKCPIHMYTGCQVQTSYVNVIKHCHSHHDKDFLKNSQFEVDLSKTAQKHHLLEHNGQLLVIQMKYTKEDNLLQFSIVRRENGKDVVVFPYELKFTCGWRELSIKCHVIETVIKKISFDSLIDSAEENLKVDGTIFVGVQKQMESNDQNLNEKLVKMLTCPWCSEHIFETNVLIAVTHNITYDPYASRPNVNDTKCSKCQATVKVPSLNQISDLLIVSCKNALRGCQFRCQPKLLKDHEKECQFGIQVCPIKCYVPCSWTGLAESVYSHLISSHRDILLQNSYIVEKMSKFGNRPNLRHFAHQRNKFLKCYILRYAQYLFLLIFFRQNQKYFWAMQRLGEFQEGFRCEIELTDNKNGEKVSLSHSCSKQSTEMEMRSQLSKYSYLLEGDVENLLNDSNELRFEVRIFKE